MTNIKIPPGHPRAESLRVREKLIKHFNEGVVATAGLIAHGRGEAFDYLIGEKTTEPALKAIKAAASALLTAKKAVISINGNTAALVADGIVRLAQVTNSKIEVNLFYRSLERELAIKKLLEKAGAHEVLGVGEDASARIPELGSDRRCVNPQGILMADVVLVPLEDGDRTEALIKMSKKVIAIDLNPLSRTAQQATITIVDNVVRAIPKLMEISGKLKQDMKKRHENLLKFNNKKNLAESTALIRKRLSELAERGEYLTLEDGKHDF
ncbi:phosphopantothenate/pantothenate synthetase [Candidatus Bathyarchaeota archaeon]|nr:phosphopantothenate/pantothenate synthetase [Candidatus Bathyarchaeota archaeon]